MLTYTELFSRRIPMREMRACSVNTTQHHGVILSPLPPWNDMSNCRTLGTSDTVTPLATLWSLYKHSHPSSTLLGCTVTEHKAQRSHTFCHPDGAALLLQQQQQQQHLYMLCYLTLCGHPSQELASSTPPPPHQ